MPGQDPYASRTSLKPLPPLKRRLPQRILTSSGQVPKAVWEARHGVRQEAPRA